MVRILLPTISLVVITGFDSVVNTTVELCAQLTRFFATDHQPGMRLPL